MQREMARLLYQLRYQRGELNLPYIGIFRNFPVFQTSRYMEPHIKGEGGENWNSFVKFIPIWQGEYSSNYYILTSKDITEENENYSLEEIEMNKGVLYLHGTCPMRRLVDLLNHMLLHGQEMFHGKGPNPRYSWNFMMKWLSAEGMIEIHRSMRVSRRVTMEAMMLEACYSSPELMDAEYDAYLLPSLLDTEFSRNYVYLPKLKWVCPFVSIPSLCINEPNRHDIKKTKKTGPYGETYLKVKLFLFKDETRFKKKIQCCSVNKDLFELDMDSE
jgi:hypothetical protein